MQDNFKTPLSKEEFLEKARPVTIQGARAVIGGLDNKLKRVAGPLIAEKTFFEQVLAYKKDGTLPERFNDGKEETKK